MYLTVLNGNMLKQDMWRSPLATQVKGRNVQNAWKSHKQVPFLAKEILESSEVGKWVGFFFSMPCHHIAEVQQPLDARKPFFRVHVSCRVLRTKELASCLEFECVSFTTYLLDVTIFGRIHASFSKLFLNFGGRGRAEGSQRGIQWGARKEMALTGTKRCDLFLFPTTGLGHMISLIFDGHNCKHYHLINCFECARTACLGWQLMALPSF